MNAWGASAQTLGSLKSTCKCSSRPWTCRGYTQRLIRCSSWHDVSRRSAILGTGASLAALSVGPRRGLALAMSGANAIEKADLDGLSISQVCPLPDGPCDLSLVLPGGPSVRKCKILSSMCSEHCFLQQVIKGCWQLSGGHG